MRSSPILRKLRTTIGIRRKQDISAKFCTVAIGHRGLTYQLMGPEELIALHGMFSASNVTIADIDEEQRAISAELAKMDRFGLGATVGAMLASPSLQANAYRLEALLHIAMVRARGQQNPQSTFIQNAFISLGNGICGRLEDPAEDLFSTSVYCRHGNFTVFEGLRESNGFYLQRVLDVIEDMPEKEPFSGFRRSIFALLTLSDAVARRAGVSPFIVGEIVPRPDLSKEISESLGQMAQWVLFSENDPEVSRISFDDLQPFLFEVPEIELLGQSLGHTSLERYPLLQLGDLICLALPTAVGSAVTRYVLEMAASLGVTAKFEIELARGYWELLASARLIPPTHEIRADLQVPGDRFVQSVLHEVDSGRFLNLILVQEHLEGLEHTGFLEVSPASMGLSHLVMESIARASEIAAQQSGFREGITLVIDCGLGRASILVGESAPENWRIEYLSIPDALTMAWMEDFSAIDVWRILDSKAAVDAAGISLSNLNGLLNLMAWANSLKGHLVPHGELPESFRDSSIERRIYVQQNALLDLRRSVQTNHHAVVALNEDDVFRQVRRIGDSTFEDDKNAPLYIDERALHDGELKAVYITAKRFWWVEIQYENKAQTKDIFEHWRMLCAWLQRAAQALDDAFADLLPRVVTFKIRFQRIIGVTTELMEVPSEAELGVAFDTSVDRTSGIISIRIGDAFNRALGSSENVAERLLVEALVFGTSELARTPLEAKEIDEVVKAICPSPHARARHLIRSQNFRDMIRGISSKPVTTHQMDDAMSRVGLAFRVQQGVDAEITGTNECTAFLNRACQCVLEELCALLKSFDRRKFIESVLENHESAAINREWWRRTSHAVIGLHGEEAIDVIAEHVAEMNGCSVATRILIEAALCECPAEGGSPPGELDLSRAMAKVMFVFHVGGWSDAVHWGAIAPLVKITPLGDIHIDHTFMHTVYYPFVQSGGKREVRRAVDAFGRMYVEPPVVPSISELLEARFLDAWKSEYRVSVDNLRHLVDELERIGVELNSLWFERRRSELVTMLAGLASAAPEDVAVTIDLLTLPIRARWMSAPAGFRDKDWHPWRFRRRLSLVRRPLIPLEDVQDPTIIVAPALVREALLILLRSFHDGETPDWQVKSMEMRKWMGHSNNVERAAFNKEVASKLEEFGWKCEPNYKITKLLGFSLDRDYGDVDALAWDPNSGRVLAIECKDLHFHKTLGEVAEQLSDFRGIVKPDGSRDLLRKHLDRISVMEENKALIASRLGLQSTLDLEGFIVFRNPVPMQFAWEKMQEKIKLLIFDQLDGLRISV